MILTTFPTLSSPVVEPFTQEFLTENVLKRLMAKKIYYDIRVDPTVAFDNFQAIPKDYKLFTYGKSADYFILILEGRVKVVIGKENQTYEGGPFVFFGTTALKVSAQDTERVNTSTSFGRLSITDGITPTHRKHLTLNFNKPSNSVAINSGLSPQVVRIDVIDVRTARLYIGRPSGERGGLFHTRLHCILH